MAHSKDAMYPMEMMVLLGRKFGVKRGGGGKAQGKKEGLNLMCTNRSVESEILKINKARVGEPDPGLVLWT